MSKSAIILEIKFRQALVEESRVKLETLGYVLGLPGQFRKNKSFVK